MVFPTDNLGRKIGRHNRRIEGGGFNFDIARGIIPNTHPFEGYGDGIGLNGNNYDVWTGPTQTQPEPVFAGYQPNLISSNNGDGNGNGVGQVEIHYINTAGERKDEQVILNGTTLVNMVATDVVFVNYVHAVVMSGTGIVATGNIDLRNGTTVMNRIPATGNVSLSAMRMVPANFLLFIDGWRVDGVASTTKIASVRLRGTTHNEHNPEEENRVLPGVYHFIDVAGVKDGSTGWIPFPVPDVQQPFSVVKVSAWTTGAINISASWRGHLEPCP